MPIAIGGIVVITQQSRLKNIVPLLSTAITVVTARNARTAGDAGTAKDVGTA